MLFQYHVSSSHQFVLIQFSPFVSSQHAQVITISGESLLLPPSQKIRVDFMGFQY